MLRLRGVEAHYERKEQILFPYLERQGFMGPSKVMWGKDNEIRALLKTALAELDGLSGPEAVDAHATATLFPLVEEVDGMIFKEENILFPTSLEKLQPRDWVSILRQSDEIGYVFIQKPEETEALIRHLQSELQEEALFEDGTVSLPSGTLDLNELMCLLNTLPLDLTFVDREDTVKYFSEGTERAFHRPRSIIGRKVQNCHPPQSLDVVEGILASFKEGNKDYGWLLPGPGVTGRSLDHGAKREKPGATPARPSVPAWRPPWPLPPAAGPGARGRRHRG